MQSSRAQGCMQAQTSLMSLWVVGLCKQFLPSVDALKAAVTEARDLWAVLRSDGWHLIAQQSFPGHKLARRALALRPVAALQAMQGEIKRLMEEVKALLKKHDAQAGLIMTIEQRVSCPPAAWAGPHVCVVGPCAVHLRLP